MTATRIRVQLQQAHNDIHSVTNERIGLTFLEIAMAVRTLYENTVDLFPKKNDQVAYKRAADKMCETLHRGQGQRALWVDVAKWGDLRPVGLWSKPCRWEDSQPARRDQDGEVSGGRGQR